MSSSNYNPFVAASSAAFSALTNADAINYYQRRAQEDIDTVIDVATSIYTVCAAVYAIGAFFGELHYSAVTTHTVADVPALPAAPAPIAALPPAKPVLAPAPRRHNNTKPIANEVIVPASISTADLMAQYTKSQMLNILREYGHDVKPSFRKSELAELLATV